MPKLSITFNSDSTFEYVSTEHPNFYQWENFSEKGRWSVSADTIILNPQLTVRPFVQYDFSEQEVKGTDALVLTFNHIKRFFDAGGKVVKTDTLQINRLDYAFNELKKTKLTRVAESRTVRCAFAGFIPPEIITKGRTITVAKPVEKLTSIFIGCYELQGYQEVKVRNANANHLTFNVYSNYYQDGQLRQKKLLMRTATVLYSNQKPNGKFEGPNWGGTGVLFKQKKAGI